MKIYIIINNEGYGADKDIVQGIFKNYKDAYDQFRSLHQCGDYRIEEHEVIE
jgi:hypothetical protein